MNLFDEFFKYTDGTLGFQIFYQNGSKFQTCTQIDTLVFFNCDTHEEWDISNPNVTEHVTSFIHNPVDTCVVMICSFSLSLSLSIYIYIYIYIYIQCLK